MDNKIYDKVKWHYPEGINCHSLEEGKLHIEVLMKWLLKNNLLSSYGKEIYELGINGETSVTSEMITKKGIAVMDKCYDKWVKKISYGKLPSTDMLDECLTKII